MSRTKAQQSEETTKALLAIAERHFSEFGYENTSTEKIVEEAQVTRGALYHHFGSKQGLYEAVVQDLHQRVAEKVKQSAELPPSTWDGFLAGCEAWLEASIDPVIQKVMIVDAPAVLGWDHWLGIDAEYGFRLLKEGLSEMIENEEIQVSSEEALLYLLNGALNQAAIWVSASQHPEKALEEAKNAFKMLLEGLRN